MTFTSEKKFSLNHGWEHFWYDPQNLKNLYIKQFVKGPFAKPKLVCSIPFVISCQYDGTLVKFYEGIPDCWVEYLTHNLRFFQESLPNYELMQRENEDVVSHLRKYRLYLGQGIPDPWTTYPYVNNMKAFPHVKKTDKHSLHRKRLNNKKERCLCCEREYLFECPDECPSSKHNCQCKDCHSKIPPAPETVEKCRCSEIFHNWLLENSTFNRKKKRDTKGSPSGISSPNGSNSESDGEGEHSKEQNKFLTFCECFRNRKQHDYSASENSGLGDGEPEQLKVYFCPYIKKLYGRKLSENYKINSRECKPSVSKEIQAEIQPVKYSKTVQTEKSEMKAQLKCTCHNKCFPFSNHHCNKLWLKAGCSAIHSIPSFCCTSSLTQHPIFAYPHSLKNHFTIQKPHKNDTCERKKHRKKNQHKWSEQEEGSDPEHRLDQNDPGGDGDNMAKKRQIKEDLQEQVPVETQNYFRHNKNIYNCQPPPKSFDHLKYLSDFKLKRYFQQGISPVISPNKFIQPNSNTHSKFINFCRGNSSLNNLRQEGNPLERFKSFSSYKPRYSESSFMENKINFRQGNLPTINSSRYNNCDQATMTSAKEVEHSENGNTVSKSISEEMIDGKEPRVCHYGKNQEVTKVLRKRRKLLRNRKRRRKLVGSIMGYQNSLIKSSKVTIHGKEIKDDGTTHNYIRSKKTSPKNFSSLPHPCENSGLSFGNANLKSRFTYLQKKARPVQTSLLTIRAKNSAQQQASAKNRRLAMQMERRLSATAALKIKKKSIRQRLGVPNSPAANVRDRLTLPARGKGIRRGRGGRANRGRTLRRSQSMQSLQGGNLRRSASMQSLNQGVPRRSRSRSRSRSRARTPSRNRSNSINRQPQRSPSVGRQRRFSTGSFGTPAPGIGRGGARTPARARNQRLRKRGNNNKFVKNQRGAGNSNRGGRGNFQRKGPVGRPQMRGGRRGRSRSGIRGRIIRSNSGGNQTKVILPSKEELDKQLEQYMANTKSHLDQEIDTYMKESGVNDL